MLSEQWRGVKRVLAVRLDNIGDVVMLGPALRTLHEALPGVHITLMASPAGSQVAPLLPWVDDVLTQRVVWQDASGAMPLDPQRELELVATLREGRYDAALVFTSFSQSPYPPAYACYLAGIPIRVGQSKEFGGSLLTHRAKPLPDSAHQAERNLFLLESAGFEVTRRDLELRVPAAVQERVDHLLHSIGIAPHLPFAVLAPGASCPARMYDPRRFAQVARLLVQEARLPVVVVGSERERELIAPIVEQGISGIAPVVGQTTIPELAGIIRRAALVVANDSGPMHMADAFRRPMVILYSGTELESQWGPRAAPTRLLRRPTPCSPCYNFTCPYNMECLDIPPEEVLAEALGVMGDSET